MTHILHIHLLGAFEILREGQPLTNRDWRSQQTRTLGKILLARRGQVVTSDQIIEILWPDIAPETARSRLHVRTSQFRSALGAGKSLLQTVDGGYLFSPDETCWLDVDEFQAWLEQGRRDQDAGRQIEAIRAYEQARQHYRGDYLAEDLYADWTFAEREYYRERFLTLLIELSECYAQQGRYRLAIARAQEALARDPLRETIYVRLMLYHYYAGERAQALRVYERCREVLADELAVAPLDSTVILAEKIRSGALWADDDDPRYPPPIYAGRLFEIPFTLGETPFVGRDREYAWLVEQWQDKSRRVILLEGEAGIGKSRLVEVFTGYIASQGVRVLRARVSPADHAAYAPLFTALQPLVTNVTLSKLAWIDLAVLSGAFPEIKEHIQDLPPPPHLSPELDRQRFYQAITGLAEASSGPPTLLLVDDAHRLDSTSIEMLKRLSTCFQILLSYRSEETPPAHPIRKAFGSASRKLAPLTGASVLALIRSLAGSELGEMAAEINAQSGGNPLYLMALLQHMFESGQLYVESGGAWGVAYDEAPSLPPTVRETIEVRLQRLQHGQRRVFDLAAVLGGEFDFNLLREAIQKPEIDILAVLDELIDGGLIVEPRSIGRSEFAIAHDRYIEVAYATLPDVRRKNMHLRAAQAIEKLHAEHLSNFFPALATHYRRAEHPERESYYAALAGEQAAAQFANEQALRYLSRALELTASDAAAQRARLLLAREKIHEVMGARERQKEDLDALEALGGHLEARQRAEICLRRAGYEWILGNDDRAQSALAQSIGLAQSCGAVPVEAAAYLLKGRGAKDQSLARQDLNRARLLARQEGLRPLEGDIVRCLGNACYWQGSYVESQAYFEEALRIHREVGDLRGELSALNNLGFLSRLRGDSIGASASFEQALTICRKVGDRLGEGVLLTNLGELANRSGDYRQAQSRLKGALIIREQIANEEGVGVVLNHLGDAARHQGQYARAKGYYERALEINERIDHSGQTCASLASLSELCRQLGDYARARLYSDRALEAQQEEESPERMRALANGSLLRHVLGENIAALELGERALSRSSEIPAIQADALTNLGYALTGLQRFERAQQHFHQALEIRRSLAQPHLCVEPLAGLAQLALAQDDLGDALKSVEEILRVWRDARRLGPDRLLWVYLTCYQVLHECRDRRADDLLHEAYRLLQLRASTIEGDEARDAFLSVVPENREIAASFQQSE